MIHIRGQCGKRQRFVIRKATQRDIALLVHQRRGMWEDMGFREKISLHEADKAYSRLAKAEIKKRNVVGWIVETSNKVVAGGGCLWLRPAQPRPHLEKLVEPYLMSMFTEPEFRRSGVASKIVNEAIKWCKRNSHRRILLHGSKMGRGLYQKYGFTRTWENATTDKQRL